MKKQVYIVEPLFTQGDRWFLEKIEKQRAYSVYCRGTKRTAARRSGNIDKEVAVIFSAKKGIEI